jgi:tight adherence protein B
MTSLGWLALAALAGLTLLPAPVAARVDRLEGQARLRPSGPARPTEARAGPAPRGRSFVAVVAIVAATSAMRGPALGLAAGTVVGLAVVLARDRRNRRSLTAHRRVCLAAMRTLIGELEAGSQPAVALEAAASAGPQVAPVFRAAAAAAARGGDAGAVLVAGPPDVRRLGLAWQLAEGTGMALGGVLARAAGDLAAAEDQRRTVDVALAGPRSSAAVLALLPGLGCVMGMAMGARPLAFLIGSNAGRVVCCAGVLLDAAGVLWLRGLLRRAEAL